MVPTQRSEKDTEEFLFPVETAQHRTTRAVASLVSTSAAARSVYSSDQTPLASICCDLSYDML